MKLLGVLSPVKNSTVSLDLLNLYVVNQISCQKKTPETMRKPIHVNMNRDIKMPLKKHDLELPMSPPCVPSKLCIDDLESSMHHQRLGSKEELGPVQLSQGMDSYRIFEPQFNRVENCSFTPSSFSAELSSNRNVTEQNFIPRIAPSPQKVACEKKQNEQNLIEEGRTCSIKGAPKSTKKIFNNNDSSQSSLSSSYSPRATDSCFSSSSEMPSDDEDQTLQKIEDSSRRSIKTEETTNNFYLERMAEFPRDRIVKNNEKIHKQTESFHQVSVKNNTDQSAQSQHNSTQVLQNQTSNNCTVQFVRCDAWVQTESEPVMKERLDAAIQCDIISQCKCRSNESSLCNVERCSENIKADTTGGQEILKNN
ncbi:hypothetical protein MDA_GLEAN10015767 [Myotis davidii]|uniref:Uncharacterized protein n=1 Tax=Myotis davidii TaxID=225400 RepID=L5LM96_MYODS|nr:hypothetical protein MDA_GLEAN10015767 [Myotis davidii]